MRKLFNMAGVAVVTLGITSQAMAVSCEVEYKARRIKAESRWYGSVDKFEFKSGTAKGKGDNLQQCKKNAEASVENNGWKVTSSKLM